MIDDARDWLAARYGAQLCKIWHLSSQTYWVIFMNLVENLCLFLSMLWTLARKLFLLLYRCGINRLQMLWAWCLARINQQISTQSCAPFGNCSDLAKDIEQRVNRSFEANKKLISQGLHLFSFDINDIKTHKSGVSTFANYHYAGKGQNDTYEWT